MGRKESSSPGEIQELAERYASVRVQGVLDEVACSRVLDNFARAYQPIVVYLAHRIRRGGDDADMEDVISDGFIGFLGASGDYDPARGVLFTTFACPRVRGAMIDGIRERFMIPRLVKAGLSRADSFRTIYYSEHGEMPSDEECRPVAGLSRAAEVSARALDGAVSYETSFTGGSSGERGSFDLVCADPRDDFRRADLLDCFEKDLEAFPSEYRRGMREHLLHDRTLKEVGALHLVSESRMSQLRTSHVLPENCFRRTREFLGVA